MARYVDPNNELCSKSDHILKQKSDYLRCPSACEEWEALPMVYSVPWPRKEYFHSIQDAWAPLLKYNSGTVVGDEQMQQLARLVVYMKVFSVFFLSITKL